MKVLCAFLHKREYFLKSFTLTSESEAITIYKMKITNRT